MRTLVAAASESEKSTQILKSFSSIICLCDCKIIFCLFAFFFSESNCFFRKSFAYRLPILSKTRACLFGMLFSFYGFVKTFCLTEILNLCVNWFTTWLKNETVEKDYPFRFHVRYLLERHCPLGQSINTISVYLLSIRSDFKSKCVNFFSFAFLYARVAISIPFLPILFAYLRKYTAYL